MQGTFVSTLKKILLRCNIIQRLPALQCEVRMKSYDTPSGMPGSGAGRGGGAGGSVRESGGRLGEYGAANEEHYFFNKQRELLEKLKKKIKEKSLTRKEEK